MNRLFKQNSYPSRLEVEVWV